MAPHTPPTLGSVPGNPGRSSITYFDLLKPFELLKPSAGRGGRLGILVALGHAKDFFPQRPSPGGFASALQHDRELVVRSVVVRVPLNDFPELRDGDD